MQSLFNFIVKPKNTRYDNKKYIDDSELLLNTEISDHRYISRTGIVTSVPKFKNTKIKKGNEVIIHHNVFRRWYNVKGVEKNSRSYYMENKYFVSEDQIFLYKQNNIWKAMDGYCFIKPIKSNIILEKEVPLRGIIKYVDNNLKDIYKEDLIGFTSSSEYEFIIEGERLYRVPTNSICIKYERQGNEKEYNPSWA
jgi:sulfur transfer complex TusBCD TusB component (DsrH family)